MEPLLKTTRLNDESSLPTPSSWRHLPRFFMPVSGFEARRTFELDRRTVQHAVHARRLKVGQYFIVFDGKGTEYLVQMESIVRSQAFACWKAAQTISRESALHITLFMSLIASDKMDWIIQKGTELGVTAFQPVITLHSFRLVQEKWAEKRKHWFEVAISACEQSGRNQIPEIFPLMRLPDAVDRHHVVEKAIERYLLSPFAERELGVVLTTSIERKRAIYLLVGPEGGLDEAEEAACSHQGWISCGLGVRILRAETAALAALSRIQFS